MTPEQFRRRRDDLCSLLGFPCDDSDDAILARLLEIARHDREDPGPSRQPAGELEEDRRYLARLLRSFKAFSHLVTDPPRVEAVGLDNRHEYASQRGDREASPYPLLMQVEIGYKTDAPLP